MHQELPIIFWLVLSVHVYSTRRWMHGRYRTCTLTPWSRALLEKLTGSQLVNKFPAFYGTRRFITAFTNARHLSLSWAKSIQSTPPHPTSWRSILILSSHLHLGLPTGLFPSGFPTKTLYTPLISPIRAACPDHLILLNWSRKQYWVRSTDHCQLFTSRHSITSRNVWIFHNIAVGTLDLVKFICLLLAWFWHRILVL